MLEAEAGEEGAGDEEEGRGEPGSGKVVAGDLRTYSNQPPARPEEMQAAKMAASPRRGFWSEDVEDGVGETPSSWTVATPTVRSRSENHFVRERDRLKKSRLNMAVVSSLSCEENDGRVSSGAWTRLYGPSAVPGKLFDKSPRPGSTVPCTV